MKDGLLRRSASLRKCFAFVAGNDEENRFSPRLEIPGLRRRQRGEFAAVGLEVHQRRLVEAIEATRVVAGDSRYQGRTSEDYWAFVGPFGGVTAATILRALMDHPQRAGDPLSLTVNFCAPIAQGAFDLDVRLVKANRSTQHCWSS